MPIPEMIIFLFGFSCIENKIEKKPVETPLRRRCLKNLIIFMIFSLKVPNIKNSAYKIFNSPNLKN